VTERDYRRLLNLAFDLGDEEAYEEALLIAARRGDNETGRLLLGRFDREGVLKVATEWLGAPPSWQEEGVELGRVNPLWHRGVRLCWSYGGAVQFAVATARAKASSGGPRPSICLSTGERAPLSLPACA